MTDLYAVYCIAENWEEELEGWRARDCLSVFVDFNSALESTAEFAKRVGEGSKFEIIKFSPGQYPLEGEVLNAFGDPVRVGA